MEALRIWGIPSLLVTPKEFQLATLNVFLSFVYTLQCSCQCMGDCVEWKSMWKNWKMGDLSNFERGQIVGVHLAGASVTKITTLLGTQRETFLRLHWHTWIMGRQHQQRRTVGESQHWLKEINCHTWGLFQNITELLQHKWQQKWLFLNLEDHPQKLSYVSCTNLTFMVGLRLLNLWSLKVMLGCVNDGHAHKIWTSDRKQTENTQSGMPGSSRVASGRFSNGLRRIVIVFCWSHYYPSWVKAVHREVG
jgi:hypothetical protein